MKRVIKPKDGVKNLEPVYVPPAKSSEPFFDPAFMTGVGLFIGGVLLAPAAAIFFGLWSLGETVKDAFTRH